MQKLPKILFVLFLLSIPVLYWGVIEKRMTAPVVRNELPSHVLRAENSLAVADLVSMSLVDLDFWRNVPDTVFSPDQKAKIENYLVDQDRFLNVLTETGVSVAKDMDYVLRGNIRVLDPDMMNQVYKAVPVYALFGRFDEEKIIQNFPARFGLQTNDQLGEKVYLISFYDEEYCKKVANLAMHIRPDRVVLTSTEQMTLVLDRLNSDELVDPEINLSTWRKMRDLNFVSSASFDPMGLGMILKGNMTKGLIYNRVKDLEELDSMFMGMGVDTKKGILRVGAEVVSEKEGWLEDKISDYKSFVKILIDENADLYPNLSVLVKNMEIEVDGGHAKIETHVSVDQKAVLTDFVDEVINNNFYSLENVHGERLSSWDGEPRLVPEAAVVQYLPEIKPEQLYPFDFKPFKATEKVGPFGLKPTQITYNKNMAVPEILFQITSSDVFNAPLSNLHQNLDYSRARVYFDKAATEKGWNVLRQEDCGFDRNQEPASLHSKSQERFQSGKSKASAFYYGYKNIRLMGGAQLGDVTEISGRIDLDLSVKTKKILLEKPFAGKTIKFGDLRISFLASEPHMLKYTMLGSKEDSINKVLSVRAMTKDGWSIERAGHNWIPRQVGYGRFIEHFYYGVPELIEIVVAEEDKQLSYPFTIRDIYPPFDKKVVGRLYDVKPIAKNELSRAKFKLDDPNLFCRRSETEGAYTKPYFMCPVKMYGDVGGGKVMDGIFRFLSPYISVLEDNPGALSLSFDQVLIEKDGKTTEFSVKTDKHLVLKRTMVHSALFDEHTIRIKSEEEFPAGKVTSIKGKIRTRIPTKMGRISLDVKNPGHHVFAPDDKGTIRSVSLVGFRDSAVNIEIDGLQSDIAQIIAFDEGGQKLKSEWARSYVGSDGILKVSVTVSAKPASLEIYTVDKEAIVTQDFVWPIAAE